MINHTLSYKVSVSLALALSTASLATAAPVSVPAHYGVKNLGLATGFTAATANAVNDAGQVAGTVSGSVFTELPPTFTMAAVFRDGAAIGIASSNMSSTAKAINTQGHIAGYWFLAPGAVSGSGTIAFVYTGFYTLPFGVQGATETELLSINASDVAAGYFAQGTGQRHAALRTAAGGLVDLGTFGAAGAEAHAINLTGQIAGVVSTGTRWLGFVTSANAQGGSLIGALAAFGDTTVNAMNDAGTVVGSSVTPDGHPHAFVYQNGSTRDLGVLAGHSSSSANGVNGRGLMVGRSIKDATATTPEVHRGWVSAGGRLVDLNGLLDNAARAAGWTITSANGVNASGQIAANAVLCNSALKAVLLTPEK